MKKITVLLGVLLLVGCSQIGVVDCDDPIRWVAENVKYTPDDPGHDEWQLPYETMDKMAGDCEDHVILAMYLLWLRGVESTMLIISLPGRARGSHAILMVNGIPYESLTGEIIYYECEIECSVNLQEALLLAMTCKDLQYCP